MCKFSVIIPVYNVEKYLNECVDSVLAQSYQDFEIILIDDGSTDLSGDICDQYEREFNCVKVVHQNNYGLSEARNTGIRTAQGKYLVFLDSDDYFKEDGLGTLSQIIEKNNPEVIINNYYCVTENTETLCSKNWKFPEIINASERALIECSDARNIILTAWCVVVRKDYLMNHNLMFYPGIKHEDELWTPQIIINSNKIAFNEKAFYCYRMERPGSIVKEPDIKKLFDKIFIVDKLTEFAEQKDRKKCRAVKQRCAKLITGVIRSLVEYSDTKSYKMLMDETQKRIGILCYGQSIKYIILYLLCSLTDVGSVSKIWNK